MFRDSNILIWSENPDILMKFYRDVLELELIEKVDIPKNGEIEPDYGYMFKVAPTMRLWIGRHSDVKGKSREPVRIMHNLFTDEVEKWYQKVKAAGCEILCPPIKTPFYTEEKPWYVSTFMDPEGNAWQFMGTLKT